MAHVTASRSSTLMNDRTQRGCRAGMRGLSIATLPTY